MANHAYVYFKKLPELDEVVALFNRVSEELKLNFVVETEVENDNTTFINFRHKDEKIVHICYWLHKLDDVYGKNERVTSRKPCLEVRHGHGGYLILWWIEMQIEWEIQKSFKVHKWLDGGIGYYQPTEVKTFADYIRASHKHARPEVQAYLFETEMEMQRQILPEDMHHLLKEQS